MCGIAGYIGTDVLSKVSINNTLKVINHRGPDDSGFFSGKIDCKNIVLIHTRLSIIDLEKRSSQPFESDNSVLIFNGEIYNFVEIREELKKLGCSFKTRSDTEVLNKSLRYWGLKALDKFEGMWSFAWFDKLNNKVIISRDRFGEKPFYYFKDRNGFYFASEVKALKTLLPNKLVVNNNHLIRYLVNGYKSLYKTKENFFSGVTELNPGKCIIFENNSCMKEVSYWNRSVQINQSLKRDDCIEGTRNALINSVKIRLRSDVPLAFCLSGGVDSNAIVSIAKKILGYDVHGFTVGNKDTRYQESDIINNSVSELGLKHTVVSLNADNFINNLSDLINSHDAPVYTISYYTHWLLMNKIANDGYKVVFSGTGADELYTGYYDHHNFYLNEVKEDPELFNDSIFYWKKYISKIVRNPFLKNPNIFVDNPQFRDHIFLNSDIFSEYLKFDWKETFSEENYHHSILRSRMMNELFHEAVPVILHEDDLNAMQFSIENRSPFLDRRLYEFAYSIPTKYLINKGFGKSILRDSMNGIVPDKVLKSRRKVGFNSPIDNLINLKSSKTIERILDDGPIFNLVKKHRVEELLKGDKFENSASKFLFYFINARIFLEQNS